ncbi:hypothetical protein D3C72_2108770 [compost metagenome]
MLLNKIGQRQGIKNLTHQIWPVFEQEKQQINHDAEANRKAERALADQEGAARQILSAF